jgi:hypothetical protein
MTREEKAQYFAEFKDRQEGLEAEPPPLWRYLKWSVLKNLLNKFDFWDGGAVALFFLLALVLMSHELLSGQAEWGWFTGLLLLWFGGLFVALLWALVSDFKDELKHARYMELYPDDDSLLDIDDEFPDVEQK